MKQEVSRRHAADKWELDDVVLTSEVTHPAKDLDGIKEAPAEGVYVYGLFLDGCAWSAKGNRLIDSEPKKLFNPLPVLYVTGVQVDLVQHPSSEKYVKSTFLVTCICCMSGSYPEYSSSLVKAGLLAWHDF